MCPCLTASRLKEQEDKTLRIKDTSGLHLYRVRPSHSFTPLPSAKRPAEQSAGVNKSIMRPWEGAKLILQYSTIDSEKHWRDYDHPLCWTTKYYKLWGVKAEDECSTPLHTSHQLGCPTKQSPRPIRPSTRTAGWSWKENFSSSPRCSAISKACRSSN